MTSPPTGTVTFMFTDVEGSTKMWERSPHAIHRSLSRHDEILREAIESVAVTSSRLWVTPSVVPSQLPLMRWNAPWKSSVGYSLPNGSRLDRLG